MEGKIPRLWTQAGPGWSHWLSSGCGQLPPSPPPLCSVRTMFPGAGPVVLCPQQIYHCPPGEAKCGHVTAVPPENSVSLPPRGKQGKAPQDRRCLGHSIFCGSWNIDQQRKKQENTSWVGVSEMPGPTCVDKCQATGEEAERWTVDRVCV